jgi:RNA polymerase sigma-70 factor (ECF subfamily)
MSMRGTPQLDCGLRTLRKGSSELTQAAQPVETTLQDEQLIAAVAHGDRRAFETIYDRYAPAVFGLALKMLRDREVAEEIVQEVFWRVWQRAGSFDCKRSFAPWLFGIAHNACIDELRRQRMRPQSIRGDDEYSLLSMIPDDTDVSELALHVEQRRSVAEALQQLPVEQRQALTLAYFGGLTQPEIAEQVEAPLGTVKTRIRLGLQKLRDMLQVQELIEA